MPRMNINVMRLHSQEDFQIWLAKEVEVREELETLLGKELSLEPESLDVLEAFLLRRYRDPQDILQLEARPVLDAAARHVGLVMVLNVDGSEWEIDLKNTDKLYYALPIIRLPDGGEECPLATVTTALERRTGEYLRTVVDSYAEQYNADDGT